MTKQQHALAVLAGDIKPRVFQDAAGYVAWTPTWEGPPRPDYAAACADLADRRWGVVNAPGSYGEYQYEDRQDVLDDYREECKADQDMDCEDDD
jgi:hypothetical protein